MRNISQGSAKLRTVRDSIRRFHAIIESLLSPVVGLKSFTMCTYHRVMEDGWVGIDLLYFEKDDSRFIEHVEEVRLDLPLIDGQPPVTIRLPIEIDGGLFFDVFDRERSDDWPVTAAYRFRERITRGDV